MDETDLSRLAAHAAEIVDVPRGRKPKPNPMGKLYEESLRKNETLAVDVVAGEAKRVARLLRGYAMDSEKGVSVQIQRKKPENYKGEIEPIPYDKVDDLTAPGEIVTVAFLARHERML